MAVIFPPGTNRLIRRLLLALPAGAFLLVAGIAYTFSPRFTDVGYRPRQPLPFSHRLHAGELELDCRYCHFSVEISAVASLPPTSTCMNCHRLVGRDNPALAPLLESDETGLPIAWVRVHKVPEYAYFHHGVHWQAGIGCSSCHGDVTQLEVIQQVEPLSMSWCLDCHRNPSPHVRPKDRLTDPHWQPENRNSSEPTPYPQAAPTDCTACHR